MNAFAYPRVSVVISAYNQIDFLTTAIESAQQLVYPNLEIVIADDVSTDGTREVIEKKYMPDPRVKYFRNEVNLRRVRNYRKGLYDYATGDWAMHLDGDDYLTDKFFIRDAIEASREHPDLVLIAAGQTEVFPGGSETVQLITDMPLEYVDGKEFFLSWPGKRIGLAHLGALYKRDLATRIGFYTEDVVSTDWESLRRLVVLGEVALLGRSVGVWRYHESNVSRAYDVRERLNRFVCITGPYDFARDRIADKGALDKWRKRALVDFTMSHYVDFITGGEIKAGREFLSGAFRSFPEMRKGFAALLIRKPSVIFASLLLLIFGKSGYMRFRGWRGKLDRTGQKYTIK